MKKEIKLFTDDQVEFSVGYDKEQEHSYLHINSLKIDNILDKEVVSSSDLEIMLIGFKSVIDNVLKQLR